MKRLAQTHHIVFLLVVLVLAGVYMLLHGAYWVLRPSERGEEILSRLDIPHPALIAHRGASYYAPESTLPAFRNALENGVDYLEADIRRTRDGRLIVLHDATLRRTSNVEDVYPERARDHISTFLYEELLELDFGSWFNKAYPRRARHEYEGLGIVTLDELLELTAGSSGSTGIVLDVKAVGRFPGVEEAIVDLLEAHDRLPRSSREFADIVIFSFHVDVLRRFQELAPDIPRMFLIDDRVMSRPRWRRRLAVAEAYAHGLGVRGTIHWPWHTARAHERGLFVFPYVTNELWEIRLLSHLNSSGFITDRPELVRRFLDSVPMP